MSVIINEDEFDSGREAAYLNMAFGADFETDTGNSGSMLINCHYLLIGEAAQKIVIRTLCVRIMAATASL